MAVNVAESLVLTDDGVPMVIRTMIDAAGDETDDPGQAVVVVAEHPNGSWWAIDLREFEPAEVH